MFRGLASPQRLHQQPRRDLIREESSCPPMGPREFSRSLITKDHPGSPITITPVFQEGGSLRRWGAKEEAIFFPPPAQSVRGASY